MDIQEIKNQITLWAKEHKEDDSHNYVFAEVCETDSEKLIVKYCMQKGYTINGFPQKLFNENLELIEEDEEDDINYRDHFLLYMDTLALEKPDVTELVLHYHNSFWPDSFDNEEVFKTLTKDMIKCNIYDVTL